MLTQLSVVCGVTMRPHVYDDVIKWIYFPRYWPFVRGIHRSPVNSPHKGQGRGALIFSLTCVWINGWVNNREAGDLRRYLAHYDVTVKHIGLTHWRMYGSENLGNIGSSNAAWTRVDSWSVRFLLNYCKREDDFTCHLHLLALYESKKLVIYLYYLMPTADLAMRN